MTDEEIFKRLDDYEEHLANIGSAWRAPGIALRALLWFAIPFSLLWSIGVSPEHAARAAVCPFVSVGLLMVALYSLVWSTARATIEALQGSTKAAERSKGER